MKANKLAACTLPIQLIMLCVVSCLHAAPEPCTGVSIICSPSETKKTIPLATGNSITIIISKCIPITGIRKWGATPSSGTPTHKVASSSCGQEWDGLFFSNYVGPCGGLQPIVPAGGCTPPPGI